MSVVVHAHSQQQGHVHHPAAFAALDHQRIGPHIRVRAGIKRSVAELGHGVVQFPGQLRHLRLRQRRNPQRLDQALDLTSGYPPHIGFGHHLHERPLASGAGIQEPFREVRTPPQLQVSATRSNPPACSHRRVRDPLGRFTRSGLRSLHPAPQTTSASVDIKPCAKPHTISRNKSLPSASSWNG